MIARRGSVRAAAVGVLAALAVAAAGCTANAAGPASSSPGSSPGSSSPPTHTVTSIVGTSTSTRTLTTIVSTRTVSASDRTTVTATPTRPTVIGPPPSTREPAPVPGTCPYLSDEDVMYANGQHPGRTSIIATKPYPVCVFTRADGGYLATTRIVVAATAAQAAAAVNQHVPVAQSSPASYPAGWAGGAMATPKGVPGYPDAASIYAVSKGRIAVIAISNQAQSIKGRQMAEEIIANLHL